MSENVESAAPVSPLKAWLLATRPKTLTAVLMPVAIGAAYASRLAETNVPILLCIFASALLIQIGTNLANDYSDYKSGADASGRLGPVRVTQSGLIAPQKVKAGAIICYAGAVAFGIPLILLGGWPILLIGVIGIICGWAYTGGPFPLGYNGLGELFVLLFFGVAAVMGTAYLLTGAWTIQAFLISLCPGLLASALLVVNNVRDLDTDRITGKRTLAARFGRLFGRWELAACLILPYVVPALLFWFHGYPNRVLLPIASLPLVIQPLGLTLIKTDGPSLNRALAGTSRLILVFGLLFVIGLVPW